MIKISLLVFLIALLFSSCIKSYKRTIKLCDDKLYVEVFNVNPAGVDADYLTDSLTFRYYVGKWDNEHENFNYTCKGDSIIILKQITQDTTSLRKVVETRRLSVEQLRKENNL